MTFTAHRHAIRVGELDRDHVAVHLVLADEALLGGDQLDVADRLERAVEAERQRELLAGRDQLQLRRARRIGADEELRRPAGERRRGRALHLGDQVRVLRQRGEQLALHRHRPLLREERDLPQRPCRSRRSRGCSEGKARS